MSLATQLKKYLTNSFLFPQLLYINIVKLDKEKGGYTADGEILDPSTFERTGEILTQVPITTLSATNEGAGIYATAQQGHIAIIQYLNGNITHPIITGYYTQQYPIPVDNKATISIHTGNGTVRIANTITSLATICNTLIDTLTQLTTQGGPSTQVVSPTTIIELQKIKTQIGQLLQE